MGAKTAPIGPEPDLLERGFERIVQPAQTVVGRGDPDREHASRPAAEPGWRVDPYVDRGVCRRDSLDRPADEGDPIARHDAEESKRQVKRVRRRPAQTASFAAAQGLGPRLDLEAGGDRDRQRDEQACTARCGPVAWTALRGPMCAAQRASNRARSSTRTRRASCSSRQPTTSTVLSSSSLYVAKKFSISSSRCGRT
jgi:hypothetical protein